MGFCTSKPSAGFIKRPSFGRCHQVKPGPGKQRAPRWDCRLLHQGWSCHQQFHFFHRKPNLIKHWNHEDLEELDDQEDVKHIEQQQTKESIAPQAIDDPGRPTDDPAFVKMGIRFVEALRMSDWKLVDDYGMKVEKYLEGNQFSRSQRSALWSLLISKLWEIQARRTSQLKSINNICYRTPPSFLWNLQRLHFSWPLSFSPGRCRCC